MTLVMLFCFPACCACLPSALFLPGQAAQGCLHDVSMEVKSYVLHGCIFLFGFILQVLRSATELCVELRSSTEFCKAQWCTSICIHSHLPRYSVLLLAHQSFVSLVYITRFCKLYCSLLKLGNVPMPYCPLRRYAIFPTISGREVVAFYSRSGAENCHLSSAFLFSCVHR